MSRPPRRIWLAWKNLTENPWRLAASVAGTAFAVVLMLVQNGFRNALLDNMVAVIVHLDGELFLTAPTRYVLAEPVPFPRRRLELRGARPGWPRPCRCISTRSNRAGGTRSRACRAASASSRFDPRTGCSNWTRCAIRACGGTFPTWRWPTTVPSRFFTVRCGRARSPN